MNELISQKPERKPDEGFEDFTKRVHSSFKKDLKELLKHYGAEIAAKDYWEGYPECGEDIRMKVWFDCWADELDLGKFIN